MLPTAITVENLGKRYRIGSAAQRNDSLREVLVDAARAPFRNLARLRGLSTFREGEADDIFWALRDISFSVQPGESLGIIGRNGAGKSTLLKILSRIVRPTEGRATVAGRLGSLLEVGTGFPPELTGRDNIYLNGSILGMDRAYIDRQFDAIVEFSGVERFLDTPVKRYSSGMYTRLAFSVAAHLEPDILIVDEVLAVGDAAFQKKCLSKMDDVAASGRTVLFVSHNLTALQALCRRSILIDKGRLVLDGSTEDVVGHYLDRKNGIYSAVNWISFTSTDEIQVLGVRVLQNGREAGTVHCRAPFTIELRYELVKPVPHARVFLVLRNEQGEIILSTSDYDSPTDLVLNRTSGRYVTRISFPANLLRTGTIFGTVGADIKNERVVFANEDAIELEVVDGGLDLLLSERHARPGVVAPLLEWETSEDPQS